MHRNVSPFKAKPARSTLWSGFAFAFLAAVVHGHQKQSHYDARLQAKHSLEALMQLLLLFPAAPLPVSWNGKSFLKSLERHPLRRSRLSEPHALEEDEEDALEASEPHALEEHEEDEEDALEASEPHALEEDEEEDEEDALEGIDKEALEARVEEEFEQKVEEFDSRLTCATDLRVNWNMVEFSGEAVSLSGDFVETRDSEVDRLGLFAIKDIPVGTLVTIYPVHRMLLFIKANETISLNAFDVDEADEEYFENMSLEYAQTYLHPTRSGEKEGSCLVDASPVKQDLKGWLGHRINDGAKLDKDLDENSTYNYYVASSERRNVVAVALHFPLVGFVATRDIKEGEELFATYGHSQWLGLETVLDDQTKEAIVVVGQEVLEWQNAIDEKYSEDLEDIEGLLTREVEEEEFEDEFEDEEFEEDYSAR